MAITQQGPVQSTSPSPHPAPRLTSAGRARSILAAPWSAGKEPRPPPAFAGESAWSQPIRSLRTRALLWHSTSFSCPSESSAPISARTAATSGSESAPVAGGWACREGEADKWDQAEAAGNVAPISLLVPSLTLTALQPSATRVGWGLGLGLVRV